MTSTDDAVICYGNADPGDTHLFARVVAVDDGIVRWLERRERRKRSREMRQHTHAERRMEEAGAPEVEITPEMIEAGVEALASRYFDLLDSYGYPEIARTVFEAMAAKIRKPRPVECQTA